MFEETSHLQIRRGKRDNLVIIFHSFSTKIYVVTPHLNHLTKMVLLRDHNICLNKNMYIVTPHKNGFTLEWFHIAEDSPETSSLIFSEKQ